MNPEYRILEGSIVGIKIHVDIMDVNEEEVEEECQLLKQTNSRPEFQKTLKDVKDVNEEEAKAKPQP